MTEQDLTGRLRDRYPSRSRPVGFYPLPTTRVAPGAFASRYRPVPTPGPRRGLLYVHVPFCRQRCAFCRFYPGPYRDGSADTYTETVLAEAAAWGALRAADPLAAPIEAVFLGGGSPSALSIEQLTRVVRSLRDSFPFVDPTEITLEWYPKDADPEKFAAAAALGVSRVSFGIQTWNPVTAKGMGTWHTADQADLVLATAVAAGFTNFNIDLMLNVPEQSLDDALRDVERALSWQPSMISLNPLEVTEGTPLAMRARRTGFRERDDEKQAWLHEARQPLLAAGYRHQRARNFALPGRHHRYNRATVGIDYDIVPIGPGAYGFVGGWALINALTPDAWAAAVGGAGISVHGLEAPSNDELRRSFAVTSMLELFEDTVAYQRQFGNALADDFPFVGELLDMGAMKARDGKLWLVEEAAIFSDDVGTEFSSSTQGALFARHLKVGRTRTASQYFPVGG